MIKAFTHVLVDLPRPASISGIWNMGSLLGVILVIQILTGVFLAAHYSRSTELAFKSVDHIMRDVNLGWLIRVLHANGARVFFLCGYIHAGRGIYYGSFRLVHTWILGVRLLLVLMATAFLGYVLPWGQISFWGATVITNLFSAIPILGGDVVTWLWGGFSVDNSTLTRFFRFHFVFPFVLVGLTGAHLLFLHERGSSSPLGINADPDKIFFHPYFSVKDILGAAITLLGLFSLVFFFPWLLGDPENFIEANPMVTPVHIQPEWYFLFAYAILRSIPNKLGGVVALAGSVVILYFLPIIPVPKKIGHSFFLFNKFFFWSFIRCVVLLTWIGARPVEAPYIALGQGLTVYYFSYFLLFGAVGRIWDWFLK